MTYSEKALQYVGVKQGSKQHKAIVDYYNTEIKPLPQGYKMKYTDSWCACFVSVIMDMCKGVNIPYECSVKRMTDKARKNKQIVKTPQMNDLIVYDWKNNGTLDHVGIICGVNGDTYAVVEGNMSKKVGVRYINKSSNEIECYIRVNQSSIMEIPTDDLITRLANDVIRGKYGTGKTRKQLLGDKYDTVQKKVNEILGSSKNT